MENIDQKIIDKISKIAKKKKAEFPEKYIDDIASAYIKRELTDKELETLIIKVKKAYDQSKIESGEAIGAVVGQSIGEAGTQMTLNTFHDAGVGSSFVTYGLERLNEVINLVSRESSNLPSKLTAIISVYFKDKDADNRVDEDFIKEFASNIAEIRINDVLQDFKVDYANKEVKLEIDIDKINEKQIELNDVFEKINKKFNKGKKYTITSDENILILKPMIDKKTNDIQIRAIRILADKVRDFQIAGFKHVNKVTYTYDKNNREWIVYADVTKSPNVKAVANIFRKILKMKEIEKARTIETNHIPVIHWVLGIEAARNALIDEFYAIFEEQAVSVDMRHIMLLADMMTADGTIQPIGRFGISGNKSSVLARAAFEGTGKHLLNASMRGEIDELTGVIENIIIGQPIPIGTGSVSVMMKNK
ncbi:MAG: DNA-directed RNA polymerase subunit A'' [Methanobrevibacter sp.]|nr:DNA-directed RNA polymerase subunit A'' [Methanobrevibacter sp.]